MARRFFFDSTRQAHTKLSKLFDFVWPTACASWNLRHQIAGYIAAYPSATDPELKGRFITGSKITGANLRGAFVDRTWEDHLSWFSDNLLTSLFPLYEAWIEDLLVELAVSGPLYVQEMQFPAGSTIIAKSGKPTKPKIGVTGVIARLTQKQSALLAKNIHPGLTKNEGYSIGQLDNLMRCYRYFKEVRNSRMHAGGRASDDAVQAYLAFLPVATAANLNVTKLEPPVAIVKGSAVDLSLRSVVGFGEIVMNVFATVDAELACSRTAEVVFADLWRKTMPTIPLGLPRKTARRYNKLSGIIDQNRLPNTRSIAELDAWLQHQGIIKLS